PAHCFATCSLLRRELAEEFATAAAKPFSGRSQRHHSKFLFLSEKSGTVRFDLGCRSRSLLYPTGTHPFLGTGTFSIGPTVVVLEQIGGWTAGGLMNQLWSVAIEEDRKSRQPAIPAAVRRLHTMRTHTTFVLSS